MTLIQFSLAAIRAKGNPRLITRLWNVADCRSNPEPLWRILAAICPEQFDDSRDPNSIRFTY